MQLSKKQNQQLLNTVLETPFKPLFDTHTHFDETVFDIDRETLALNTLQVGVSRLVLVGYKAPYFERLLQCAQRLNLLAQQHKSPSCFTALGLHPLYIAKHQQQHLDELKQKLNNLSCVAVGEIGLDTYIASLKEPNILQAQVYFFEAQLDIANAANKPVLLHVRKSHALALNILKQHQFKQGGIAHAFSGGVEEAKAFINLGFKLGVTGQICNTNAKKLRDVVKYVGATHLVIETDCPDMLPQPLYALQNDQPVPYNKRNTPQYLPYVLMGLADCLAQNAMDLMPMLWQNSVSALKLE